MDEIVQDHVRKFGVVSALYFKGYEGVARTQAIQPAGLRYNQHLLTRLLEFCPSAELNPTQLRQAIFRAAQAFPALHTGTLSLGLWAGDRATVVGTMLKHVRRYSSDATRRVQAMSRATDEDVAAVEGLTNLLQEDPQEDLEDPDDFALDFETPPTVAYGTPPGSPAASPRLQAHPIVLASDASAPSIPRPSTASNLELSSTPVKALKREYGPE